MLQRVDKALAGAIDVVADDIQATVKSVREQGVKATLRDAVEDAGKLVVGGAGNVISGVIGGKRGGDKGVSNHSGMSSGYADLCAPPGARFGSNIGPMASGSGGAAFPYVPDQSAGRSFGGGFKPGAAAAGGSKGFAPGIGIQRAPAGGYSPGGVQVFAKQPGAPQMGFHPFPGATPAPAPYTPMPAPYAPAPYAPAAAAPAPSPQGGYSGASYGPPPPATGKEPPVSPEELAMRIQAITQREVGNQKCADCAAPNPDWASVSFGVLLCIECGGHHRQMGTHISRIRSCKMDSWTERQLQIFDHGGNRRFDEFCTANGISNSVRFQRYHTPAAEWYREAWIKNRIFSRPVPPPPAGVVVGPCKDTSAAGAAKAKAAEPQADLLEFGGGSSAPAAPAAAQADLLGFGDAPAATKPAAAANADLLGVSSTASGSGSGGGGDLLGLGGGGSGNSDGQLLDFAAIAANARPPASALAGLDLNAAPAPAPQSAPAAAPQPLASLQMPAAPAAAPSQQASVSTAPSMANTLGGGAKLIDPPKDEKNDDPFAMALNKWGM